MIAVMIVILCAVFALSEPENMGYVFDSGITDRLAFHFAHANAIHLAINCYCFYRLSTACEKLAGIPQKKIASRLLLLAFAFATTVATSYATTPSKPVVGLSGVLFAYAGYGIAVMCKNTAHINRAFITLAVMLAWQDVFLLFTSIFAQLHVQCMLVSFALTNIYYYGRGFYKDREPKKDK